MKRQKIDVTELAIGMYVSDLDRPWLETPFIFQGFPISTQEEIATLKRYCKYVYIDTEQSRARAGSAVPFASSPHQFETRQLNYIQPSVTAHRHEQVSFDSELKQAATVYSKSKEYINAVFADARLGRSIDPSEARDHATRVVDSVIKNENALVWLTQLKNRDEYTVQHSINVCVLSVLFGHHLGLGQHDLRELGFGALLHDIGKMRIPQHILNKLDKLTDDEMELMKQHPEFGYQILKSASNVSESAIDIARSHHERIDGSGYPRKMAGDSISLFSKLVSIVDVYDAITSDRVYHMGISPHEALNLMYGWAPRSFNGELLQEFIRCLGIYPIGSIVELDSGEVGVVMTVNRTRLMRPVLTLVLDREKKPLPSRKLLNLELLERSGTSLGIRRILGSNAHGINVRQIIMESQVASALN
jgi:putative nucleotidyltransferase with HDIG domain